LSQADYSRLIDAQMWAYIRRLDEAYPPDATSYDVAGQRRLYDEMCALFRQPRPPGIATEDAPLGGVPCRFYRNEEGSDAATVLYLHGGGFVVGGLESHDDVCAEICARTGFALVSVDYRLAPENPFPRCFEDAWAALAALAARQEGPILLAGDSAGGNLAAALAHHARGRIEERIAGQVLIYPGLGGDMSRGSYITHAEAPHLTRADLEAYRTLRSGGAEPPQDDPRYAPLQDSDFSRLPPTVIITAECDPLSSDGESYRDALRAAGGRAHWSDVKGMVHACLRARTLSDRAAGFFDEVVSAIAALGQGRWPYP
jgi:acetyl esterase